MNVKQFKNALDFIRANPDKWDQHDWWSIDKHGNFKFCFAGVVCFLNGLEPDTKNRLSNTCGSCFYDPEIDDYDETDTLARMFLDIDIATANYLFDADRTIEDFETWLENYLA